MTSNTRASGFSLVEIVVSLGIVAIALASLAPVLLQSVRAVADARAEMRGVVLAMSRVEQLAALDFEQRLETLAEVTDQTSDLSVTPPASGGRGLQTGPPAAVWRDSPGLVDWAAGDGTVRTPAPRDRVFLRRWAIARPPSAGADTVGIQVFAREIAREARESPRTSPVRRPGDIWLYSMRARVLR